MIHFHRLLVFLLWMLVIATWRVSFHLTVFHEEVTQALLCSLWKCTLNSRVLLPPFLHVEASASQLHLVTSEKVFVTIWSPCRNHWGPHNEQIGVHWLVKGQGLCWEVSALTINSLPDLGSGTDSRDEATWQFIALTSHLPLCGPSLSYTDTYSRCALPLPIILGTL